MTVPILIDGGSWANGRGFGRFARCLVHAMAAQATPGELGLILDADSERMYPIPEGVAMVRVDNVVSPSQAAAAGGARSVGDLFRFARAAKRAKPSVIFFPATYTYFPAPGIPTVVTVHDAMAESMPQLILPSRLDRIRWAAKQRLALRSAAHVFTVSQTAASQVGRRLKVPIEKLSVIGEAPDPAFHVLAPNLVTAGLASLKCERPYLLYVGGFGPHKNVGTLLDAFDILAHERANLELVLVGSLDDPFLQSNDSIVDLIKRSEHSTRIRLTGFVSDEDLIVLYNGAVATALPSFEEGFGLTAVESAACGTPVVANRLPSVEESLGDAALIVDATNPQALAEGLRRVLDDHVLRERLSLVGLERAEALSWPRSASVVLDQLRALAATNVRGT